MVSADDRGRGHPPGERFEDQVPDRQIRIRAGSIRVGWRGQRSDPVDRPGDDRQLAPPALVVGQCEARDLLAPLHREVGVHHLVLGRQVEPDLEQLGGVRTGAVEQGEHLAVDDARPAVSHWTSPRPKRAVAPSESEWSMSPCRT